jgi:hypothetical protein
MKIRESTIWLVSLSASALLLLAYLGGFLDSPNWALAPLVCPFGFVIIVIAIAVIFRVKGEKRN